jgi:hypothetical protein
MSESDTALNDEEAPNFDISDTALEAAAGEIKHKAGSQTISFCSGIDTCPSYPR